MELQSLHFKYQTKTKLTLEASTKKLLSKLYCTQCDDLGSDAASSQPLEYSMVACRLIGGVATSTLGHWILSSGSTAKTG